MVARLNSLLFAMNEESRSDFETTSRRKRVRRRRENENEREWESGGRDKLLATSCKAFMASYVVRLGDGMQ